MPQFAGAIVLRVGEAFIQGSATAALGCVFGNGRLSDRAVGCADELLNVKSLASTDWLRSLAMIVPRSKRISHCYWQLRTDTV